MFRLGGWFEPSAQNRPLETDAGRFFFVGTDQIIQSGVTIS